MRRHAGVCADPAIKKGSVLSHELGGTSEILTEIHTTNVISESATWGNFARLSCTLVTLNCGPPQSSAAPVRNERPQSPTYAPEASCSDIVASGWKAKGVIGGGSVLAYHCSRSPHPKMIKAALRAQVDTTVIGPRTEQPVLPSVFGCWRSTTQLKGSVWGTALIGKISGAFIWR